MQTYQQDQALCHCQEKMKAFKSHMTKGLQRETRIETCDNSGAKILRIISFQGGKGSKRRHVTGGLGQLFTASVQSGNPDMRKKVVQGIIVRQCKEIRRADGKRLKFEDIAAVVLKDNKGNMKGTLIKGAVPKEVIDRWPL